MRITVTVDDGLLEKAQKYTGITDKPALIGEAWKSIVAREAGRRLAALGGTELDVKSIRRRRSKPVKA